MGVGANWVRVTDTGSLKFSDSVFVGFEVLTWVFMNVRVFCHTRLTGK